MNFNEIDLMEIMKQDVESIKKDFTEMKSKLNEMYYSLIGSPMSKDGGIIKRVENLEEFKAHIQAGHEIIKDRLDELDVKTRKRELWLSMVWLALGFIASSIFTLVLQAIFKVK
jgi:hypothetical protein